MTEQELIDGCKKQDRLAQQAVYDRFSPKMMGVCRRYLRRYEDAEDILIEGFFKVFKNIGQYNGMGSFEGWIRRIMVNESLMFLRKRNELIFTDQIQRYDRPEQLNVEDELVAEDILKLLAALPNGYRTIFNMYVIEGYKHREIAEQLGISINTSKSQLILAKKRLRALVEKSRLPDEMS